MKKLWMLSLLLLLCSGCSGTNRFQPSIKPSPIITSNIRQQAADTTSPVPTNHTPDLASGKELDVRTPNALTLTDLRQKYRTYFIFNGPADKRQVALSFDDGPDDIYTPKILDVLNKYGVKATFFLIGNRAEAYPELVKRIAKEGHVIANHSYNHPNLPKITDAEFQDQVLRTVNILHQLVGYVPKLFRPPYGNINSEQIEWMASQQLFVVNWNVDSLDWKNLNADQVYANIMGDVQPGSIILQHSAGGTGEDLSGTVEALPRIIEKLQADGVKLVTIPELLGMTSTNK
ncbi:polysaccharide deacetylase family protein [Paenibacillus eucommiae]|uniref:Peptidoglycan/xylan/chitin deacetylase (PgdA/CDA1 family) n=1 Tax=Paenibacillus eucommiae TaxID=1355755 RepID=A0ABS4INI1_9BACL|nr:polysaccharide deacetylase family protein [Paenibacillus eucommiae]MBP1989115.1 peptidoglycan/xylan/chitin deacetylase (PgdA/CDA1 family) [Paenibacillus eucommiae]